MSETPHIKAAPSVAPPRPSFWHRYANPAAFMRLSGWITPFAVAIAVILLAIGAFWGLIIAPPDYQQGDTVRIMYIHVPSSVLAMGTYGAMAVASLAALIWRHPVADMFAKASAPIGVVFTALSLITGSLWGEPMWGTWWVWDARLTSVLVLFFIYLGYMALWTAIEEPARAGQIAAVYCLVGSVMLPIIKYSVDWWNTLHQPASMTIGGKENIHNAIYAPLLIMLIAFYVLYIALALVRTRTEIRKRRIRAIRQALGEEIE